MPSSMLKSNACKAFQGLEQLYPAHILALLVMDGHFAMVEMLPHHLDLFRATVVVENTLLGINKRGDKYLRSFLGTCMK